MSRTHLAVLSLVIAGSLAGVITAAGGPFPYDRDRPAAGLWVGTLTAGGPESFLTIAIEHGPGGWTARATTLAIMALDRACEDVQIDGDEVALSISSGAAQLRFEGRVSDDGQRFTGTTTSRRGGKGTFELTRSMRPSQTAQPIALDGKVRLPNQMSLDLSLVFGKTDGGPWVGEITIPMQGVRGLPLVDVTREGDEIRARLVGPPDAIIEATLSDGDTRLSGVMRQAGIEMPLELARDGEVTMAGPARPQHPKPPFPYELREFKAPHPDGHALAGTLTLPRGAGPFPAAVLISGSGPQDRDETIFDHKPFLVIADALTRRGIAVARFDDRGVGASTGSDTRLTATMEDFATDVEAVVKWVRSVPSIHPGEVGLIGHSEGGAIAPIVAGRDPRIAYVVLLAGTAVPGEEVMVLQNKLLHRANGASEEALAAMEAAHRALIELVLADAAPDQIKAAIMALSAEQVGAYGQELPDGAQMAAAIEAEYQRSTAPWMLHFLEYDPAPALARLRCPVLAMNGTLDLQVWHDQNLPVIERAARGVTVRRYEGLNHMFQPATTGSIPEYGTIETTFDEQALEEMGDWILAQVTE